MGSVVVSAANLLMLAKATKANLPTLAPAGKEPTNMMKVSSFILLECRLSQIRPGKNLAQNLRECGTTLGRVRGVVQAV